MYCFAIIKGGFPLIKCACIELNNHLIGLFF